jgi:hypothetical protein
MHQTSAVWRVFANMLWEAALAGAGKMGEEAATRFLAWWDTTAGGADPVPEPSSGEFSAVRGGNTGFPPARDSVARWTASQVGRLPFPLQAELFRRAFAAGATTGDEVLTNVVRILRPA